MNLNQEECMYCDKKAWLTHRVDFPNGYADYCSKECAILDLKNRMEDFIYEI